MPRRGAAGVGVPEGRDGTSGRERRRRAWRGQAGRRAQRQAWSDRPSAQRRRGRAGRRRAGHPQALGWALRGQTCGGPRACMRPRGCPTSRRTSERRRCAPGSSSAGPGGRIYPNEEQSRAPTDTPYPPFPYVMVRRPLHTAPAVRRRSRGNANASSNLFAGDSDYRRIQVYSGSLKQCKKISVRLDEQFGRR